MIELTPQALMTQLQALPEDFPGLGQLSQDIGYLFSCGTWIQFCQTCRSLLEPRRFCLFCNLELVKEQPVAAHGGWLAKKSDFPYPNTKQHFILFPTRHVMHECELTEADATDQHRLMRQLCEEFGINGGATFGRFGDPRYNGSSVPHMHAHLLTPSGEGPVAAHFAGHSSYQTARYALLQEFVARLTHRGGIEWLLNASVTFTD